MEALALPCDAFLTFTRVCSMAGWLFAMVDDSERVGQDAPLLCFRQWEGLLADNGFTRSHLAQGSDFLKAQAVIFGQTSLPTTPKHQTTVPNMYHFFSGGLGGLGLLTARLLVEGDAGRI
eukprot:6383057-Prymnesium_polylepis.2